MGVPIVLPRLLGVPANLPDVVYHYTSVEALLQILKTREIWATNVRYLNDVSEHNLFVQAATACIEEFAGSHHGVNVGCFYVHEESTRETAEPFYDLPFVASFTQNDDSLTHWRSYCSKGNGVSIGFRTEALMRAHVRKINLQPGTVIPYPSFGSVNYIDPSSTASMAIALDEAYTDALVQLADLPTGFGSSLGDEFFRLVQSSASYYKHYSFQDEREYRLLISGLQWRRDLLEYRPTSSTLVPYVPLAVPAIAAHDDDTGKPWTAIATITIGPTPNRELSCDAVRAYCESRNVEATVRATNVPYRDW